jgi:hydrogenase expression/formation protein HypE
MNDKNILIGHGAGGKLSHKLIEKIFVKHFANNHLSGLNDSSIVETSQKTAFTTDSYVIDPIFFPGGDIGKLAVSGTVNDLLVTGAKPKYLSAGFIIEEGFSIEQLEEIAKSMAAEAKISGVQIITGDTKVVKKGQCDKVFINTAGIGVALPEVSQLWTPPNLKTGDKIIVSGNLGDHAIAVLAARNNIKFEQEVLSDVAPLCELILPLYEKFPKNLRFMRDITRGGLATVLNEITEKQSYGIELNEDDIPVRCEVLGICEVFGYDPLYLANEGKVVLVVDGLKASEILEAMKKLPYGQNSMIVGEVTENNPGRVSIKSVIGGSRIVDMLSGEMLPRIC